MTPDPKAPRQRLGGLLLLGGLVLALSAAGWGILTRRDAEAALAKTTEDSALPNVATVPTIVRQADPTTATAPVAAPAVTQASAPATTATPAPAMTGTPATTPTAATATPASEPVEPAGADTSSIPAPAPSNESN